MKQSIWVVGLLIWPLYVNDIYLMFLGKRSLGLLWSLDVVFFTIIPSVTILILINRRLLSLAEMGISKRPDIVSLITGCALGAILFMTVGLLNHLLSPFLPWKLFGGYPFPRNAVLRWLTVIYAALTAGILEEIVYRGVVITHLRKYIGSATKIVLLSCLMFAGIHWSEGPLKVLLMFLYGIIPAVWYLRTRSLWGPIACHVTYGMIAFTVTR